jgi:hypothetical protein
VKPQWEVVTEGLRDLIAGIELAGYDWSAFGQPRRQEAVDGLNSTEPDAEVDAATEVLTAFYLGNCIATAPVTFTG